MKIVDPFILNCLWISKESSWNFHISFVVSYPEMQFTALRVNDGANSTKCNANTFKVSLSHTLTSLQEKKLKMYNTLLLFKMKFTRKCRHVVTIKGFHFIRSQCYKWTLKIVFIFLNHSIRQVFYTLQKKLKSIGIVHCIGPKIVE